MISEIQETSPWIRIDMAFWETLVADKTPAFYRKKLFVFQQEQPSQFVYILKSGRVRITSYQLSGTEKQFYIAEKGCLFGEQSCLLGRSHMTSAVAIVDSEIYRIPFEEFEKKMQNDWVLARRVMQLVCRKNSTLYQQVLELSFSQALQRISQVLLNLGKEYGETVPEGIKISIRFTHQDVANITNASRVTVSNVFNALTDEGILAKERGLFVLRGQDTLYRYASGEAEIDRKFLAKSD